MSSVELSQLIEAEQTIRDLQETIRLKNIQLEEYAETREDIKDFVSKAMRKSFQLGQVYWQQADSEYYSQNKKCDETQAKFDSLVEKVLFEMAV